MGNDPTDLRLAYITCADPAEAERIGRALVGERLVACVNLLPSLRSLYWWQGRVDESVEVILIAKTTTARMEAVVARVKALHSYTVPCVVLLPLVGGNPDYLAWLRGEVDPAVVR
jgi:periplasmic divalent cation tolerance protein